MNKFLCLLCCLLIGTILFLHQQLLKEKKEVNRLAGNQTALLGQVNYYRTENDRAGAYILGLQLKASELENHFTRQAELIESLQIKLKRVESTTITGTESSVSIQVPVVDSLVYRADTIVELQCLEYRDPYIDLQGCIAQEQFTGEILVRDTLTHIVHRIPKKWWFFRWGTKALQVDVVSSSPYTDITHLQHIQLK